ncbi:MAG: inner membrane protein YhaI [Actinomycetota bacterium]|jgi:uncharacterized membrane protein YhaH (DUF805 family)
MNFGEVIQYGFKNYANFSGVADRRIYWFWYLFVVLCQLPFSVLIAMTTRLENSTITMLISAASNLVSLGLFIPSLALAVRRLRDAGKNPLWLLISLLPLAAGVVFGLFGIMIGVATMGGSDFASGLGVIVFGFGGAAVGAIIGGIAAGIVLVIFLAQPTRTLAQGNRYAQY